MIKAKKLLTLIALLFINNVIMVMKIWEVSPLFPIIHYFTSKKDINELKSMGAKIDGNLTVSVAKGVKVLKHNAQSEPKVFGLFGGYKWEIKSPDADPFIVVQP